MQTIDLGRRQSSEVLWKFFNRYTHESAEFVGSKGTILDRLSESIATEPDSSKPAFELGTFLRVIQRLTSENQVSYEELTSRINLEDSYRRVHPVNLKDLSEYILENTFYCADDQAMIAFLTELYILAIKGKLYSSKGEFRPEPEVVHALHKLVAMLNQEKQQSLITFSNRLLQLNN